ncbi:hypothetical protein GSI_09819 [Ganoderma sinense ZZ0214-1]|uniref:Uncharacterized protein n=1 Tax=Ganoderma sinense ZZ0214-1 TaxID=1077348 RepID=A0A2G8S2R9_9APHY|nr:hypothetical protein GSI_09819 [Ganoderma sinense ZZ0214-1]
MGTVFEGVAIGLAACVLSLSTNALATLLVACKAWQLRRRLRRYLGMGSRISQVQKLLSLLIESGAVYCALLAVLLTFQVANLYDHMEEPPAPPAAYFLDIFAVIANGVLIPIIVRSTSPNMPAGAITHSHHLLFARDDVPPDHRDLFQAIYPTVVIIFVALNKSHMEKGFTQHLESVPTPHITSTADTIAAGGLPRHANINDLEDAGRRGDEELKVEGIA